LWDSNAAKGTPSKGLLQVIDPTFNAYHVAGTSFDIYDPVANITAACNYAAARYGSMDNVHGAY
ncbi:transglycosylase SLT domain-containing protein, partial [Streptomyces sp. NPDC059627]